MILTQHCNEPPFETQPLETENDSERLPESTAISGGDPREERACLVAEGR